MDADFSDAKLAGADFRGATLLNARFSRATLGCGAIVGFLRAVIAVTVSGAACFVTVLFVASIAGEAFTGERTNTTQRATLAAMALAGVLSVTIFARYGLSRKLLPAFSAAFAVFAVSASLFAFMNVGTNIAIGLLLGVAVGVFVSAFAGAAAVALASVRAVALGVACVAALVCVATVVSYGAAYGVGITVLTISLAVCLVVGQVTIVYRVRQRHEGFSLLSRLGVRFGAWGGTRFVGANCTGACFDGAVLAQANFAGTNLTRVWWRGSRGFAQARLADPVLAPLETEKLVLSGNGRGRSFVRIDLHDLNLAQSDLRDADLTESICTGTDFTGAKLTGACLESWNIDAKTVLREIECEYVYLLQQPVKGNRKRRPADLDRCFEPGEFEETYHQMVDEIDILLKKGPSAEGMRQAFQEFSERQPEVRIAKFEDRDGAYVVGLILPAGVTEQDVERDIRAPWERMRQLETENQLLLAQNRDLKDIAAAAAHTPLVSIGGIVVNKRDTIIRGNVNFYDSAVGSFSGDVGSLVQTLRQSPQTSELASQLEELGRKIGAASSLTQQEKAEAAEHVAAIARAAAQPAEPVLQKAARASFGFLRSLADKLGDVDKVVEMSLKLFETISKSGMF